MTCDEFKVCDTPAGLWIAVCVGCGWSSDIERDHPIDAGFDATDHWQTRAERERLAA